MKNKIKNEENSLIINKSEINQIIKDNKNKVNINNNEDNKNNLIESENYESCNSNLESEESEPEENPELLPEFPNIRSLEKNFNIKQTPGEGNCLFFSLSYLIFQNFKYHVVIRQKICDYLSEHNYNDDDGEKREEEERIINMRTDGVYGTGYELEAFSKLCRWSIWYWL